ncbi:MFS transporter [Klebsiella michiganensis]|uniref:MFS transporter n=1 Tax=Klebsiella michiganensis TaxID=1134687 RepID=UPI0018D2E972|nr:MFS transporter [Klebsiella michiganensis]ELS4546603.1 MFS transporter [Klebsiella michiganensis]QPQ13748.1 MFS transporter [Klebsiella michiganensis]UPI89944.1 MFS transporter [Klebsiella michiganensis]WLP14988.1 MFS transporter [Klebsiella michiganensis]HDX8825255.1 MFS transporter [Klebsiella michiganensis]
MSVISEKNTLAKNTIYSLTFLGVLLIASNLRAPITALGPVIHEIAASFNLTSSATGLLNALPLLIFGLASPFAPLLTRKVGLEKALLAALVLITLGCIVRSLMGLSGLWVGTFVIGLGIAIANVLVVPLVKRDFPSHTARCVGLYAATMALTAAFSSGVAAPLSALSNAGWRLSTGIWVITALLGLVVWFRVCAGATQESVTVVQAQTPVKRSVWRSSVAWQVSMFMALHTMVFYTLIDWYPSMAIEHGVSASTAGYHLFLYQAIAVIANLTTAAFISRLKDQRLLGLICSLFITIGVAGILFKPAFSAVWLLFAGVGAGMSMVTCLTLFGLRTREHSQAGQLSGKAQCIGYLIGALGPYLAGIIRGHSLNWNSVLLCILVVTLVQAYFAWHAGKDRFI